MREGGPRKFPFHPTLKISNRIVTFHGRAFYDMFCPARYIIPEKIQKASALIVHPKYVKDTSTKSQFLKLG